MRDAPRRPLARIPERFGHFVYGVIQSCLTCAVAAAVASYPFVAAGSFFSHWLRSWLLAWMTMLPVVIFAAPSIRRVARALLRDDGETTV